MQASSRRFSPTRLATTLTSSSPLLPTSAGTASTSQQQGFIVLETNYRVYAYTGILSLRSPQPFNPDHTLDNPLQTAVLNLFVSLKYRFPNLVVGSITRDSVRRALNNGISADQVRGSSHTEKTEINC
jgi:transcription initiation factor TFIIH subunit 4